MDSFFPLFTGLVSSTVETDPFYDKKSTMIVRHQSLQCTICETKMVTTQHPIVHRKNGP